MEKVRFNTLVRAYLSGKASAAQVEELLSSVESDPEALSALRRMETALGQSLEEDGRTRDSLDKVKRRVHRAGRGLKSGSRSIVMWACAAVVALIVVGVWSLREPSGQQWHVVTCQPGSHASVTLPDGSVVCLRGDSRIRYSSRFSRKRRSADFSGEAYFDISADAAHPFSINMEGCSIVVKGTRFDVRENVGTGEVRTTLLSGSVEFRADGNDVYDLEPGHSLTYNRFDGDGIISQVNAPAYQALMDGNLEYLNVPLRRLAAFLSELYGKTIYLDDGLESLDRTISLELHNQETFEEVLAGITLMIPMSVRSEGDTVWLSSD